MPKTYNPNTGAYVVHSLNKGSKESLYVLVQMKIMDGAVHIQGRSPMYPKKNRPFGMVWDFHPSKEEMAQIQTWLNYCTTGGLVEPVSDEQEAKAVFDATAVKCEKCDSIMCSCGKCPKCEPGHGKLVKPLLKPNPFTTTVDMDALKIVFKKAAKQIESLTCSDCGQGLCSNCEQCHQCEGIIQCYDEADAGDYEEDKAPEEVTLNTPGLCEKCGEQKCESCNECHICENASAASLSDKEDSNV